MKKILFVVFSILMLLPQYAEAQVEGKVYALGDTINLDGMNCLVYKVDETGMHGTAIMMVYTPYWLEGTIEMITDEGAKKIKKGKMTQEDLDAQIASLEARSKIPVITKTKTDSKNYRFHVDKWAQKLPVGWEFPTLADAEDFATFYCGGIGKKHSKGTFGMIKQAKKLTSDPVWQNDLLMMTSNGFICGDKPEPPVTFLHTKKDKAMGVKAWLDFDKEMEGREETVIIRKF